MKEIISRIREFEKVITDLLPPFYEEIDGMIKNKVTYIPDIERALDTLLGYVPLGHGLDEFRKLNDYYATVHPENARSYDGFYNEIFEE